MIKEIHNNLISKKISAMELVKEFLKRAKKLNKKYNSFISFTDELAIENAKSVDEKIKKGENISFLAGIPCSVVGFKPTYGKISRSGLIAMASSLDQIGIISNNVSDVAITLEAISKETQYDSTKKKFTNITDIKAINGLKGLRIGTPKTFLSHGIENEVLSRFNSSLQKLEKSGAKIIDIDLSILEYVVACYYIIMSAEASSNLARYTGIRYGRNREYFGNEVKKRIILGAYVLSSGYSDKYYKKARDVRNRILQSLNSAFENVDLIAMPTTPTRPFKPGERSKNPIAMYLEDIFTASANLSEMPAISLPLSKNGIGLQLMARKWEDEKLLINAMNVEQLFKTKD